MSGGISLLSPIHLHSVARVYLFTTHGQDEISSTYWPAESTTVPSHWQQLCVKSPPLGLHLRTEAEQASETRWFDYTAVHRVLLGCDAVSIGKWLATFRKIVLPSPATQQAPRFFEKSDPTRRHIPGDLNDESNQMQSYQAVLVIALTAVIPYTLVTVWRELHLTF